MKKLKLKKETVSILNNGTMKKVNGGQATIIKTSRACETRNDLCGSLYCSLLIIHLYGHSDCNVPQPNDIDISPFLE